MLSGGVGALVERWFLRRVHQYGHAHELLLTFGLAFIIAEIIKLFFGNYPVDYRSHPALRRVHDRPASNTPSTAVHGGRGDRACSHPLPAADAHAHRHRRAGGHLQARMVEALGHNVQLVFMGVFGVGAALAGLAGAVAGAFYTTSPNMALEVGVMVFVVVVVGGLGSLGGAMLASLLIGISSRSRWAHVDRLDCSGCSAPATGPRTSAGC